MMRITTLATGTMVSLTALALAACGSSATDPAASPPATVEVASNSSLGPILDDADGRTLYLFEKDSGTKSACTGACATTWPPLRAGGTPTVGAEANAASLGTTPRSDGGPQVTYNGHPLYTYTGDQNPGDTNGQGLTVFGGGWFALSPAGGQVSGAGSNGGATGY